MLNIKPIRFFMSSMALLLIVFMASLTMGASDISIADALSMIFHGITGDASSHFSPTDLYVITELRLPRTLLAFLVGAALGVSGAVIQTLFRNPLADPSLIGVSSGAALGAAGMLVLGSGLFLNMTAVWMPWWVALSAFVGGIVATLIVMRVGQRRDRLSLGTLLLVGIAINALAMSGIGLLSYMASEATLRSLTFWMLGSLTQATWSSLGLVAFFVVPVLLFLPLSSRALNALLLGEAEARHLGIPVEKIKNRVLIGSALAVAVCVAITGIIGFVGLVIPHVVRLLVGANHRYVLPGSILLGGTLLMLADIAARTWVAPAELPIGIITALLGAPFFLALIMRQR